jgi:hypothetical protein
MPSIVWLPFGAVPDSREGPKRVAVKKTSRLLARAPHHGARTADVVPFVATAAAVSA